MRAISSHHTNPETGAELFGGTSGAFDNGRLPSEFVLTAQGTPVEYPEAIKGNPQARFASQTVQTPGLSERAFGIDPEEERRMQERRTALEAQRVAMGQQIAPQSADPQLLAALQQAALGRGPSGANASLQYARQQALGPQMAQMTTGPGLGGLQQQLAGMQGIAQTGIGLSGQAAALRAQEQGMGQQAYWRQAAGQAGLEAGQREMALKGQFANLDEQTRLRLYQDEQRRRFQEERARLQVNARAALAQKYGAQAAAATQTEGAGIGAGGALLGALL